MNTTLISAGMGATSSITVYTTDDEKILPDKALHLVGTTVVSTATTAVAESMNANTRKKVYERYASAYVESMSDEELESALQKMNLLIADEEQSENTKSL